jgi:hypothetical protein
MEGRVCPICSKKIVGRSDKIYCSLECRTFANNEKHRKDVANMQMNKHYRSINKNLTLIINSNRLFYIKFILFISNFCRIMLTFGFFKKKL